MRFVLALAGVLVLYGIAEFIRHRILLSRIPVRIHVNGSRGKSSVTRLITAGLRAGGIEVFAKTTGSSAKLVFPNGTESPMPRVGAPNIHEMVYTVGKGVQTGARACVIECMAVRPDLQWISEHRMLQSTHGVITNVRPDHLEVMGPTTRDVAVALSNTIPEKGIVFTSEREHFDVFSEKARSLGTEIVRVDPEAISLEDLSGFSYTEHRENVALAVEICGRLGVEKKTALSGMHSAIPDVGALQIYRLKLADKEVDFVHALAANDPHSILMIWKNLELHTLDPTKVTVLLNLRSDRLHRSGQLARLIVDELEAAKYVLVGTHTKLIYRKAVSLGMPRDRLLDLGRVEMGSLFTHLSGLVENDSVVFGMGNIGGMGREILAFVAREGEEIGFRGNRPGTAD
jgi:poly-gamma-glutamate synthase PgsB/CapB